MKEKGEEKIKQHFLELERFKESLAPIKKEIPIRMPKQVESYDLMDTLSMDSLMKESYIREHYVRQGMWGFVSESWITLFTDWIGRKKCLEVMSGRGWWSYALKEKGVDVVATDNYSWNKRNPILEDTLINIEKLDSREAVNKYGEKIDVLLMSWPYMDDIAYETIRSLYEVNPLAEVVYIGEGRGGCTANDLFFDHFSEILDERFMEAAYRYERWFGIRDNLLLGRYTPKQVIR